MEQPMTPAEAADYISRLAPNTQSQYDRALRALVDHARAAEQHDPALIDRLLAMTPGECDQHPFAVFAEGGAAPPCPWCAPVSWPDVQGVADATKRLREVSGRLAVRSTFLEDLATVLDAVDTFTQNDEPAAMADGTVLGRRTAKSLGLSSGENRDDTATWTPPEDGWHPAAGPARGGVFEIARERARQQAVEGWTPEHDDQHTGGELVQAATVYLGAPLAHWPWPNSSPSLRGTEVEMLAKAGALIAAEIDRLSSGENRDDTATWTPPAMHDQIKVDVDTSEATAILRRIEQQLDLAVSTLVRKRVPAPDERVTRQQWDPGFQPSEYGDERTEPGATP